MEVGAGAPYRETDWSVPWAQRLPELAARPLDGENLEVIA